MKPLARQGLLVGTAVALVLVSGCSSSTPEESCDDLASAASLAVDAVGVVLQSPDFTPKERAAELENVQESFDEARQGWTAEASEAGDQFAEVLSDTRTAVQGLGVDENPVDVVLPEFVERVNDFASSATIACTPDAPPK